MPVRVGASGCKLRPRCEWDRAASKGRMRRWLVEWELERDRLALPLRALDENTTSVPARRLLRARQADPRAGDSAAHAAWTMEVLGDLRSLCREDPSPSVLQRDCLTKRRCPICDARSDYVDSLRIRCQGCQKRRSAASADAATSAGRRNPETSLWSACRAASIAVCPAAPTKK
jgi:hypothetical protein